MTDPQSQNRYVYCRNNPHKYTDPTGNCFETLVDLGSAYLSYREWKENPSAWNTAMLAVDVAAVAVPFVPAVGWIGKADDIGDAAKVVKELAEHSDDVYDAGKYFDEVVDGSHKFADNLLDPVPSPRHTDHGVIMGYGDETAWGNGLREHVSDGLMDIQLGGPGHTIMYQAPKNRYSEAAVLYNHNTGYVTLFDRVSGVTHYPLPWKNVQNKLADNIWSYSIP